MWTQVNWPIIPEKNSNQWLRIELKMHILFTPIPSLKAIWLTVLEKQKQSEHQTLNITPKRSF